MSDDDAFILMMQKKVRSTLVIEYKPYKFLWFIGDLVDSDGNLLTSFISEERAALFITLYNTQMRLNRLLFTGYLNLTLRLNKKTQGNMEVLK